MNEFVVTEVRFKCFPINVLKSALQNEKAVRERKAKANIDHVSRS